MLSLILAVGGVPTGPFGLVAACPAVLSASRPANSTLDVLDVQSDGAGWILNTSSVLCALAHRLPGVVALLLAVLIIIITLLVGDWRRPVFNGGNDSPTLSAGLRDRLRRCAAMQIWEELSTPTGIIRAVATLVVPTIWKPIVLSFMLVSLYIPILRCFKDPAVGWAAAPAAVPIGRTVSAAAVTGCRAPTSIGHFCLLFSFNGFEVGSPAPSGEAASSESIGFLLSSVSLYRPPALCSFSLSSVRFGCHRRRGIDGWG